MLREALLHRSYVNIVFFSVCALLSALSVAVQDRVFNGTYLVVNKASGRRIVSDADGFSVTKKDSIHRDHMWRLIPQENASYSFVNVANALRICAQIDLNLADGFFAIEEGPVYQDQRWRLVLQEDGTYSLDNVKSRRRIEDGRNGFVAAASVGSVSLDQKWWLINQDVDEVGMLLHKLSSSKKAFAEDVENCEKESLERLAHARHQRTRVDSVSSTLQVQKRVNRELSEQVRISKVEAGRSTAELASEKAARELAESRAIKSEAIVEAIVAAGPVVGEEASCKSTGAPVLEVTELRMLLPLSLIFLSGLVFIARSSSGRDKDQNTELMDVAGATGGPQQADAEICDSLDAASTLGIDFGHHVSYMEMDGEAARLVRVQCPGVGHDDIKVELIPNGCDVSIRRHASPGLEAATWQKRFRFTLAEGLFEFREDQMQLDHGVLQLVFRACSFKDRTIRFPMHYSMDAFDDDLCWEYPAAAHEDIWKDSVALAGAAAALDTASVGGSSQSTVSTMRQAAITL